MEDANQRLNTLVSLYKKIQQVAPPAPFTAFKGLAPDPARLERYRQRCLTRQSHVPPAKKEGDGIKAPRPNKSQKASLAPVADEQQFQALCKSLVEMPRVVLIFDTSALGNLSLL